MATLSAVMRAKIAQARNKKETFLQANRAASAYQTQLRTALAKSRSGTATEQQLKLMRESAAKKAAYNAKIAAAKKAAQEAAAQKVAQEKAAKAAAEKAVQAKVVAVQKSSMLKSTQAPNVYTATTPQETEYTYSAYDTLGRKQTLTENQYNQLNKANSANTNNTRTYTVIPEEVSNSNAEWWINSNGAYEWIPITASDKAHLADLNRRTGKHMTTLTTGGAPSDEYSNKWYSTGGGNRGVGAKNVKVVSKPDHTGQVQLADGSWINQHVGNDAVSIYETKKDYTDAVEKSVVSAKQSQELIDNFERTTKADGTLIYPIESNKNTGIGEAGVRIKQKDEAGNIVAVSKSGKTYAKEIKIAEKALASSLAANRVDGVPYVEGYAQSQAAKKEVNTKANTFAASQLTPFLTFKPTKNGSNLIALTDASNNYKAVKLTPAATTKQTANVGKAISYLKKGWGPSSTKKADPQSSIVKTALAQTPATLKAAGYTATEIKTIQAYQGRLTKSLEEPDTSKSISFVNLATRELAKADAYVIDAYNKTVGKPKEKMSVEYLVKNRGYTKAEAEKFMKVYERQQTPIVERMPDSLAKVAVVSTLADIDRVYNESGINTVVDFSKKVVKSNVDSFKSAPVTSAAKVAVEVAKFAAVGFALEGVVALGAGGLALSAAKVSKPLLKKGLTAASKAIDPTVKGVMGVGIAQEGVSTAVSGDFERQKAFINDLVIGGVGFGAGSKLFSGVKKGDITVLTRHSPIKDASLTNLTQQGMIDTANPKMVFGKTLTIGNKPVISFTDYNGLKANLGAAKAPESMLTGKNTQAFSKLETAFFEKSIKQFDPFDELYLKSGLNLGKAIYRTKEPVYKPGTLEITGKAIPKKATAAIKDTFHRYDGKYEIAGSQPMQAQAGKQYVTRDIHDLEIYVDNPVKFGNAVKKSLTDTGMKNGKEFKVTGESDAIKVEFLIEETGKWDTGLEIFKLDHSSMTGPEGGYNAKTSDLAFGYKSKAGPVRMLRDAKGTIAELADIQKDLFKEIAKIEQPYKVGNAKDGYFAEQQLSEQFIRKLAGSTMLKQSEYVNEGRLSLQPAHIGRVKDVGDVTTVAAAYIAEGKISPKYEADLVNWVNMSVAKYGKTDAFIKKVSEDPVFKYIYENQKVPTKAKLTQLTDIKLSDKVLLQEGKGKVSKESTELKKASKKSKEVKKQSSDAVELKRVERDIAELERLTKKYESPSPAPRARRTLTASPSPAVRSRSPAPKSISSSPKVSHVKTKSNSPKPASSPKPTNSPKVSGSSKPSSTRSPKPTRSTSPSPRPTKIKSPSPAKSPRPSKSPKPSSSPKPSKSPKPAKSPKPTKSPRPSSSPSPKPSRSIKSGRPSPSPKPRQLTQEMKDILLYRKRKSKKEAEKQIKLNYIQSKRLIKNNLGSFESILGSSPKLAAKKVTKKPVTVSKRRKTSSK